MSTQTNQYHMVCTDLKFDTVSGRMENDDDGIKGDDGVVRAYEMYEDSAYKGIQEHNGLTVIIDGYDGEYIRIGKVLAKSAEGESLRCVTINDTENLKISVASDIYNNFKIKAPVKEMIFTHYR